MVTGCLATLLGVQGFILEQFDNPSCPHAAQNWQYYNMDDGMFVSDEPMSVDCAVCK